LGVVHRLLQKVCAFCPPRHRPRGYHGGRTLSLSVLHPPPSSRKRASGKERKPGTRCRRIDRWSIPPSATTRLGFFVLGPVAQP
jgi:hypothetical protein